MSQGHVLTKSVNSHDKNKGSRQVNSACAENGWRCSVPWYAAVFSLGKTVCGNVQCTCSPTVSDGPFPYVTESPVFLSWLRFRDFPSCHDGAAPSWNNQIKILDSYNIRTPQRGTTTGWHKARPPPKKKWENLCGSLSPILQCNTTTQAQVQYSFISNTVRQTPLHRTKVQNAKIHLALCRLPEQSPGMTVGFHSTPITAPLTSAPPAAQQQ